MKGNQGLALATPLAASDGEIIEISSGQARLWFLDRLVPGTPLYNVHFSWHVPQDVHSALLERCLAVLVERHATLRTTFVEVNGYPRGLVRSAAEATLPLHVVDVRGASDRAHAIEQLSVQHRAEPFD